jgi:hypothetical protein
MRVLAVALLVALATGFHPATGDLAVTVEARPIARSCSIASTGTIVTYDAGVAHAVTYRFVRSDGSVSPTGRVWIGGDGAVAQSVRNVWTPKGPTPWVAFEVTSPEHVRSTHAPVTAPCPRTALAAAR